MPLTLSEKKLYLLDIAWLISMAHQSPVKTPGTKAEAILQSSDSRSGVEPSSRLAFRLVVVRVLVQVSRIRDNRAQTSVVKCPRKL